eukprot:TRINITY_DN310_c0_g1_i10.p4 TRINITY_DN310_c0_g1~~TRINITY_DN310_c0_g1_i10.p4  ORF type:complete len:138 (+),score=41.66 TRINITY_DN310_c0_g1_i10:64-477(+)
MARALMVVSLLACAAAGTVGGDPTPPTPPPHDDEKSRSAAQSLDVTAPTPPPAPCADLKHDACRSAMGRCDWDLRDKKCTDHDDDDMHKTAAWVFAVCIGGAVLCICCLGCLAAFFCCAGGAAAAKVSKQNEATGLL